MLLIYISISAENLGQKGFFLVLIGLKPYISIICLISGRADIVLHVSITW
jgi:hypothetical protein